MTIRSGRLFLLQKKDTNKSYTVALSRPICADRQLGRQPWTFCRLKTDKSCRDAPSNKTGSSSAETPASAKTGEDQPAAVYGRMHVEEQAVSKI